MNESLISKITDPAARKVVYHQYLQIQALRSEIDRLKMQARPTEAIGFHVKEGEKHIETAFRTKVFKGGD